MMGIWGHDGDMGTQWGYGDSVEMWGHNGDMGT